MAAIKVTNYQNIVDFYTEASIALVGISDYYYSAAEEIVLLNVFDPEIDLLSPFFEAYLAADAAYTTPPTAVTAAVTALQSHVLNRARTDPNVSGVEVRFADINEWIDAGASNGYLSSSVGRSGETGSGDGSFKVPSEFATLSGTAGFAINAANITGASVSSPII